MLNGQKGFADAIKDLEMEESPVLPGRPSVIMRIFVSETKEAGESVRGEVATEEVEVIRTLN